MNQALLFSFQDSESLLHAWATETKLTLGMETRGVGVRSYEVNSACSLGELRHSLKTFCEDKPFDALILERPVAFPKLLVMDMDSTLVNAETIDQIAIVAGPDVGEQVAEVTAAAMRGELDFKQSLIARVSKLEGLSREQLTEVHERLPLMAGAREMLEFMHNHGCYTALVSGGFTLFAEPLADSLGIGEIHANSLEFSNDKLTGKVVGEIVDGDFKARVLNELRQKMELKRDEVWAIGDGANDLPMLRSAGVGIAYHAKPKVNLEAEHAVRFEDLSALKRILQLI